MMRSYLSFFVFASLPWQGLKANTKKLKYERIMDRKMSTSTESLCKGFPAEFRSYFEDWPDYAYLKRLFKELFYRKGFQYDNMYDWTVQNMQQERSRLGPDRAPAPAAPGPAPGAARPPEDAAAKERERDKARAAAGAAPPLPLDEAKRGDSDPRTGRRAQTGSSA